MLPLVDELVINVGIGTDPTLKRVQELAQSLQPSDSRKIRIVESVWPLDDPEQRKGGKILADQTNIALDHCTNDWCLYLQADEIIHEDDEPVIRTAVEKAAEDPRVEGILFRYVHLYGSFDVEHYSRSVYRREVRLIRKSSRARSVGDAQSFRRASGEKLWVLKSAARIFHYGWVRKPEAMKEKTFFMDSLYHGKKADEASAAGTTVTGENYLYKRFWGLKLFKGTHPKVMQDRIRAQGWNWDLKRSPLQFKAADTKKVVLDAIEKLTGYRLFEYRSYRVLK